MYATLSEVVANYSDNEASHTALWNSFLSNVQALPYLKKHRDYVEAGGFGYGDRPFHWMWKLLVSEMPSKFNFLEIGVFQGQTLSLVGLLAGRMAKNAKVVGITPLDRTGDQYATHPDLDYAARIKKIHLDHGLGRPTIINGLSFDPRVKHLAQEEGPYDLVYIDGCHDYLVVVDDITSYAPMVRPGGFLVVDDAGNNLKLPKGLIPHDWFGLEDVSQAVKNTLEEGALREQFEHLFAVGHNRVFRRH